MIETILIARKAKTGETVVLAGLETSYPEQIAKYRGFATGQHEEFSSVGIFSLNPVKKPLRLVTKAEANARAERLAKQQAEAEAAAQAEKEAPAESAKKNAKKNAKK